MLDLWWGPQPLVSKTKSISFEVGGESGRIVGDFAATVVLQDHAAGRRDPTI